MDILNIDIETFSEVDLKKTGVYKYAAHSSFEILIFCYSLNGAPVETVDMARGERIPKDIYFCLADPNTLKKAWNAQFERVCLSYFLQPEYGMLPADQWECTMIKAAMLGLPMSLDSAGIALDTDTKKAFVGKSLIRIFSIPCKPTKANGMRTRNLPEHLPEKWAQYKDYCQQDVYTEMEIGDKISFFKMWPKEKQLYILDQKINDRGMLIDKPFIENAIQHSLLHTANLLTEAKEITGLDNPKSVQQLKEWLELEIEEDIPTLKADAVHDLLRSVNSDAVKRVLYIRQQISKTSIKKYDAMLNMIGDDDCIRGALQFYGALRTGRWAGRGFQPHNLPKNDLPDLARLRYLEAVGDFERIDLLWNTAEALSQLLRTAIVPKRGNKLVMSDFSAIEARVLAWLAKEQWKIDVFNGHGKIYEATGANMFKVPIEWVTKGSHYRQRAKIAELACGYQGNVGALITMGAEKMGMGTDEAVLKEIVMRWRDANVNIVKYWYDVQDAAIECIQTGKPVVLRNITFHMQRGIFFIKLPSGRSLAYLKPKLKPNKNGYLSITYHGVDKGQWKEIPTYGGKLVENIVQAISRDLLSEKMLLLDNYGYSICLHVHDEAVIELGDESAIEPIHEIMKAPIDWAQGLPLNAETSSSYFYKKD